MTRSTPMPRPFQTLLVVLFCWLAYAVGAHVLEESTQLFADGFGLGGAFIAGFGGALVFALLWLASAYARDWESPWRRRH
jgi:hypothetical protein